MFKFLSAIAVLLALSTGVQAAMPQAPPVRESAVSDANGDAFDDSGEFVAIGPLSCPGGRCAVPTAISSSTSSTTAPVRGSTFAASETPSYAAPRPRLFAGKPVRTFVGRLFGLNRCR